MHVNAKKVALSGLMLAVTMICIYLGSIIETNTLFLLAAASYMTGIIYREMGRKKAFAFLLAAIFMGFFLSPNKFYVFSYAAMGTYILLTELAYDWVGNLHYERNKRRLLWGIKYLIFNVLYLSMIFLFGKMLIMQELSPTFTVLLLIAGQAGLWIYDRAYGYVQSVLWNKLRKRLD